MIVFVGGERSGVGKTTFINILLKLFPLRFDVLKLTPSDKLPDNIEIEPDILNIKGKDTALFLRNGAKKVLWVHSKRKKIGYYINEAFNLLSDDVIVEGNSPIFYSKFDVAFFISKNNSKIEKESAKMFKKKTDYTVINVEQIMVPYIKVNVIYANLKQEFDITSRDFEILLRNILVGT